MNIKKKLTLAVAGLAALASAGTAAVWAVPSEAFLVVFYSDASKTQIVGELEYVCGSRFYSWGKRTAYTTRVNYGPC